MKKFLFVLVMPFIFFACDLFYADITGYLDYNTTFASITNHEFDGDYPIYNNIVHIPSGGEKVIRYNLENTNKYSLELDVTWNNKPLGDTTPEYGIDYTLVQLPDNPSVAEMTLTEAFLTELDENPNYGEISATITLTESETKRQHIPYTHNFVVNTPPPIPTEASLVRNDNLPHWVLAFNIASASERMRLHSDVSYLRINGTDYPLTISSKDGSITVETDFSTKQPSVSGSPVALSNIEGDLFVHKEGDSVYYSTTVPRDQIVEYSVSLVDNKGAHSNPLVVNSSGYITYSISFDANGGDVSSLPSQITELAGTQIPRTLISAVPTRSGFTFVDWALDVSGNTRVTFPYTVNENVTFFAVWNAGTLTYIDNGAGSLVIEDVSISTGIDNIAIPSSINGKPVISIADSAFSSTVVKSVTIGEGITTIGSATFSHCASLENITLPSSLRSIGDSAFSGCTKLTSINIPDDVTSIGDNTFSGCVTLSSIDIPDNVTTIGYRAFVDCSSLSSIDIPDNVNSIGDSAFSGCTNLSSIDIPDGVSSIGFDTFSDCTSLTSVVLPSGLQSIGEGAFSGCSALSSIDIPSNVSSINSNAFIDCSSLLEFIVNSSNTYYESESGVLFSKGITDLIRYPSAKIGDTYDIPSSVTSLNNSAFSGSMNLKTINISQEVKTISGSAFDYCTVLENFSVASENANFTEIDGVLYSKNEESLIKYPSAKVDTGFLMHSSLKAINGRAFDNCINLTSITIPATVTTINGTAFFTNIKATLYASLESRPSGWSELFNSSEAPVVWDVTTALEETVSYVVSVTKSEASIEHASDTNTIKEPYREGHIFGGWSTTENSIVADSGLDTANSLRTDVVNGTTVYAVWKVGGTGP